MPALGGGGMHCLQREAVHASFRGGCLISAARDVSPCVQTHSPHDLSWPFWRKRPFLSQVVRVHFVTAKRRRSVQDPQT